MRNYLVYVSATEYGYVRIEANSKKEAMKKTPDALNKGMCIWVKREEEITGVEEDK